MGQVINGVSLTALKIIELSDGNVLHAIKKDDPGFIGFGEAYFSTVNPGAIKAWKRHNEMTLNLVVPVGKIRFVIFDDRNGSTSFGRFYQVTLSKENYMRLTLPPKVWMGFQCVGNEAAILLNVANISHAPKEVDKKSIEEINFNWSI